MKSANDSDVSRLLESSFDERVIAKHLKASLCSKQLIAVYESARVATYILGSDVQKKRSGTLKQYKKIVSRLIKEDPLRQCPFDGFITLQGAPHLAPKTLATYKSALRSYAARLVLKYMPATLMKSCKVNHHAKVAAFFDTFEKEYEPQPKRWQINQLKKAILFLEQYPLQTIGRFHQRQLKRPANYNRKPTGSKRTDVTYFEDYLQRNNYQRGFNEAVWAHFRKLTFEQPKFLWKQLAAGTFILTGCRASEYVRGVLLVAARDISTNQHVLIFRITGTKFSSSRPFRNHVHLTEREIQMARSNASDQSEIDYQNRGQAHRYIFRQDTNELTQWFLDYLRKEGRTQEICPKTLLQDFWSLNFEPTHLKVIPQTITSDVNECRKNADLLGKMFVREGAKIFPRSKKNLTPYVFRHALAWNMRNTPGILKDNISLALGHQSDRSANHYGGFSHRHQEMTADEIHISASNALRSNSTSWEQNTQKHCQKKNFGRK